MENKSTLPPLGPVALVGALRVDDPFASVGKTTLDFAEGMASHHEALWKEAA